MVCNSSSLGVAGRGAFLCAAGTAWLCCAVAHWEAQGHRRHWFFESQQGLACPFGILRSRQSAVFYPSGMMPNRVGGGVAPPASHTTVHAGPRTAVPDSPYGITRHYFSATMVAAR